MHLTACIQEPLEKDLNEDDNESSFIQEGTKSSVDDKFMATLDANMKNDELSSSEYEKGLDNWYAGFKKELASLVKSDDGDHHPGDDTPDDTSLAEIGSKHASERIKCPYDDDDEVGNLLPLMTLQCVLGFLPGEKQRLG